MAKSKIAKQSKAVKHVRNNQNVVPLSLDIPYKDANSTRVKPFDVSHLLYFGNNKENEKNRQPNRIYQVFLQKKLINMSAMASLHKASQDPMRTYALTLLFVMH